MDQEIEWLLMEKYKGEKNDAFFADCKRLALGESLGYLIGFVPFLDCQIWLDSHPLIPRPETEYWTELAINEIKQSLKTPEGSPRETTAEIKRAVPSDPHVLDLCAGSGCIGVAVAKAIPEAIVDFCEIDLSHMPTIEKNLSRNSLARERSTIYHANLFAGLQNTYDFILTNPPYIDAALNRTDESVLKNEPYIALFGGEDGLEVIKAIIKQAPSHLHPHGQLWIEHEPEQVEKITLLAEEHGFSCIAHTDQYGVYRFSTLVLQ